MALGNVTGIFFCVSVWWWNGAEEGRVAAQRHRGRDCAVQQVTFTRTRDADFLFLCPLTSVTGVFWCLLISLFPCRCPCPAPSYGASLALFNSGADNAQRISSGEIVVSALAPSGTAPQVLSGNRTPPCPLVARSFSSGPSPLPGHNRFLCLAPSSAQDRPARQTKPHNASQVCFLPPVSLFFWNQSLLHSQASHCLRRPPTTSTVSPSLFFRAHSAGEVSECVGVWLMFTHLFCLML